MEIHQNSAGKITWTARFLGIIFAAFISIFAMDVFTEGYDLNETAIALFMHMLPTLLIILMLIISWRREWIGAIAFFILGLFYLYMSWDRIHWSGMALISIPLFVLAILFAIGWYQRKKKLSVG